MRTSPHLKVMPQKGDNATMVEAIEALTSRGYRFSRPTRYQLKLDEINFYPDRGTIIVDGHRVPEPKRGLKALLALLSEL